MPNATVTIRELKNKNTGIDASIPEHKEIPGLLGTTIEYHVVVVTILQCFKLPKHKETDVVQFMIPKHIDDFEDLKKKLSAKFPGTIFPPLPKKTFGLLDSNVKERRAILETFIRFVVGSLKTSCSPILLQFLGASPLKSGVTRAGERAAATDEPDLFEELRQAKEELTSPSGNLFGDLDDDDLDLFSPSEMKPSTSGGALFKDSTTTTPVEPPKGTVKLFEDQDLGGAVRKDDVSSLFLVPDAVPDADKPEVPPEDNSDLLNIEDDLDNLLKVTTPTKPKPAIAAKPKPSPKPSLPAKPKPAPKPSSLKVKPNVKDTPKDTEKVTDKVIPGDDLVSPPEGRTETLGASDIMKYIESSSTSADADLDLFS